MIETLTWVLTALSLIGVWLNIKKRTECFIVWTFTNSAWVLYDFSIGAYAQSALFLIYVVLALYGLREWKR